MISDSKKRCIAFSRSTDMREKSDTNILDALENSLNTRDKSQLSEKFRKKLWKSSSLSISVKQNSNQKVLKRAKRNFCQIENLWEKYERFTSERKLTKIYLDFKLKSSAAFMIAIRVRQNSRKNSINNLIKTSHSNLMNLKNAFVNKTIVYLIYERANLSLKLLHSSVRLKKTHIATVCKEIRESYI